MRRLGIIGWAVLVSIWASLVGGAAIREPTIDLVPAYAIAILLISLPAAYWTMRRHEGIIDSAHRPGRVALFILVLFFVSVPLTTLFDFLLGHTDPVGVVTQWLSVFVGLACALYVAYAGGFDRAWDEYT